MASVLHGSARTTPCLRAEFQVSKESTRSLAARYDVNPKTVGKRCKRTTTADAPMGPKLPKSTVLDRPAPPHSGTKHIVARNGERALTNARRQGHPQAKGNNHALKHGLYTGEAIAERRQFAKLLRGMKGCFDEVGGKE